MNVLYSVTIVLALLLLAPPAQAITRGEQSALYTAQQAMAAGHQTRASKILEQYISQHKSPCEELYLALGNIHLDKDKLKQAEKVFRQGLKLYPRSLPLIRNLAIICYNSGRFVSAGGLFEQAASIQKKNRDLLYQAAASYYQAGNLGRTLGLLQPLVERTDTPPDNWLELLIHVCLESQKYNQAARTLYSFLDRNPKRKEYWKLLARINTEQGQYRKAASALTIALTLPEPESREWQELGNLYLRLNAPLEAAECYEKGFGKHPAPDRLDMIADCYNRAGRPAKACAVLDRAIASNPTLKRRLKKAKILFRAGMHEQCLTACRNCLKSAPASSEAHYIAGACALRLGRGNEAISFFEVASHDNRFRNSALAYLEFLQSRVQRQDHTLSTR